MKKIALLLPITLAACAPQYEPIQDHDAPLGKYETAIPIVAGIMISTGHWLRCPQDTPKWPHGLYRANSEPMPACADDDDAETHVTKQPPTKQPPTKQPPTKQPPTKQPPTKQPPTDCTCTTPEKPTKKAKRNNGLGDGDQPAPTQQSLARNQAENQLGSSVHRSGKPQVPN